MFGKKAFVCVLISLLAPLAARSAPKESEGLGNATRITLSPAQIKLEGRRDSQQIVVTGVVNGEPRDFTYKAQFTPTNPAAARVRNGRVEPLQEGKGEIIVRVGRYEARAPFTVSRFKKSEPVQFETETLPILTKQGCSTGSCHGSPHGKGGFSLSLFGYDPQIDRVSLTRDGYNRRINAIEPLESLLLKKPLLAVPHVGGKRLRKSDVGFRILRDWIAEGASTAPSSVKCERIVLTPSASRVLEGDFKTQQMRVVAHFSDGSARDITPIAAYTTSHPAVAEVAPDGKITAKGRGQAAISVRYLDKFESLYITVVEPVKGYAWRPTRQNNAIDALVNRKLRQLQVSPSGTCGDSEFLRRVSLDLTGVLPTAEEAVRFLRDSAPEKRSRKIDSLLESEEFARFWALKKADLMRVSPRQLTETRAVRFSEWLIESVRKNTPYDQFARTLLTARGAEAQTPSVNYFLGVRSQEERTEMTAQIFMGTRVECAKCHNHPFENWTMRDYYRIAAVFARTKAVEGGVRLAKTGEVLHPVTGEKMTPWGNENLSSETADRRDGFAKWLTDASNPLFARVEVNRIWAHLLGRGIVEPIDDFRSSNPPSNAPLLDYLAAEFARSGYDRKHIIRLVCLSETYQRSSQTNAFNAQDDALFSHAKPRLLTAEQLKDAIGMATRSLPPPAETARRVSETKAELEALHSQLDARLPQWLTQAEDAVKRLPVRQEAWREGEAQARRPEYLDATPNSLFNGGRPFDVADVATTLTRRIYSDAPRNVKVQWSAATARFWLNGVALSPDPVNGSAEIVLPLKRGDNALRAEFALNEAAPTFSYSLKEPYREMIVANDKENPLTASVAEILAMPAASRTAEQVQELRDFHRAAGTRSVRQRLAFLETRMEYATQRPYPELSGFTVAFGQPPRDSACTCERRTSPTLLQALELLNGGTAYQNAQEGSLYYEKRENDALIEEAYLAAFSRRPTAKERGVALKFLSERADSRRQAVADLLWTLINTQEFLFQR